MPEAPQLAIVIKALERFGVKILDNGSCLTPECGVCKRRTHMPANQLPHLRVVRLAFCADCRVRLSIAATKGEPDKPKDIVIA